MVSSISLTAPIVDSAAAKQLRAGFRWLRFSDPLLESSFRQHHIDQARSRVQTHLWLSIALVMTFVLIDEYLLQRVDGAQLQLVRVLAMGSLLVSVLVTAKKDWYGRYYAQVVSVAVPLFGACAVANELIDQPGGVSFFAAIALVVFAIYLLIGLLFIPALCSGLFILATYWAGAVAVGVPKHALIYNGTILLFANVLGATAAYALERLLRTSFLEARLLSDMANRDGLTGIYNRRAFDEHTDRVWHQAVREQRPMALLLVDIDHFKAYNDYYGHQVGDQCLQQVAQILTAACRRPLDFTARYGGEEFAVVLYDAGRGYVQELANQIQEQLLALAIAHPASSGTGRVTVSIGAACLSPTQDRSIFGFVQSADEALYEAKDTGRDRTIIVDRKHGDSVTGSFCHTGQSDNQAQRRAS